MESDTQLDYAVFSVSPRRTGCELLVSGEGRTENLASGLLKPFVDHLRVVEEQDLNRGYSIRLELEGADNACSWFNKGTLERFVRFVSAPEVLELVNALDVEVSRLEGARRMYSQGMGVRLSDASFGENERVRAATANLTKKELLKAIDDRLAAVKQDLILAYVRASSAGFSLDNVSELLLFADRFGAQRLKEACTKFISLCHLRKDLISHQHLGLISNDQAPSPSLPTHLKDFNDWNIRSSFGSDMSIAEPALDFSRTTKFITSANTPQHMTSNNESLHDAAPKPAATFEQPNSIARHLMERAVDNATKETASDSISTETTKKTGGSSRRLSVQDRINLFESKQNEQSPSPDIINNNAGKVSGKPEHRRLTSDISEKMVLRRWSSASNMSIDLNSSSSSRTEKKDSSSPMTFSSSAYSQPQAGSKAEEEANREDDKIPSSCQISVRDIPEVIMACKLQYVSNLERDNWSSEGQSDQLLGKVQHGGLNSQVASMTRSKSHPKSSELVRLKNQDVSGTCFKYILEENVKVKDYRALQSPPRVLSAREKQTEQNDIVNLHSQIRDISEAEAQAENQPDFVTKFKTFATQTENDRTNTDDLDSQLQYKISMHKPDGIALNSDPLVASQPMLKTTRLKNEEKRKKELSTSQVPRETLFVKADEDSSPLVIKVPKQIFATDETVKLQGKRDQRLNNLKSAAMFSEVKKVIRTEMFDSHIQVMRQSKGNLELNDALQIKANELEKLFDVHKHRVRDIQTSSPRKSKTITFEVEKIPLSMDKRLSEPNHDQLQEERQLKSFSNRVEFEATMLMEMADDEDCVSNIKKQLGVPSHSDEFRGQVYDKYMQKRDAKLREDWRSRRAQKEENMKAMQDHLELSQAEMKGKFAGSASRPDLGDAHCRSEKMSFLKAHLILKNKGQGVQDHQGEEEDGMQQLSERFFYAQDKSCSEHSGNLQFKKLSSSKLVSSSTPKNPVVPAPRPSAKGFTKRQVQRENSIAQSIPNFSEFRKENTKPSTGPSKVTPTTQSNNYVRSKISSEQMKFLKEENSRMSQSMRKSSSNPVEFKDLSPLNFDGATFPLLKISKKQTENTVPNKDQRSRDLRPFLRKGNGIGPGAGTNTAKLKASTSSRILINDNVPEDDLCDMVEHEEDDFERLFAKESLRTMDFSANLDEEPGMSHESGKSGYPVLEDGDLQSLPRSDRNLLVTSIGESPGSWNSNIHHSFSYAQEASDVDSFIDSPTGSPAFWSSDPLNQMTDVDVARIRRTWGSGQVPVLVPHSSFHPHMDVKKGLKRLLKFGRKSKGTECLVNDWASASTVSEGDDDTEDGREKTNRSSEDLRKSRMGYPVVAFDGLNEGEVFPEQAPRSFFSFMGSKQGK